MRPALCGLLLLAIPHPASAVEPIPPAEVREVVETVAARLERDYVFPDVGAEMAARLRSELRRERYPTDPEQLAERLTADLQEISRDGHLRVEYSAEALGAAEVEVDPEYEARERERYYGPQLNFGFERVERLEANVGLLDLRVFAPVDMGGNAAVAAMNLLAHSDALIIDLRRNGGGDGEMGALLASYLFDGGAQPLSGFYSRPKDELTQSFTLPYVPGSRFGAGKPVFVLTSNKTFSAAEAFAYDLQALKRATIVGESTGGGAHPFEYVGVHPHFVLWLVTGRSVNPITGGNWQGTGVLPDVQVPAEEALDKALELAHHASAEAPAP